MAHLVVKNGHLKNDACYKNTGLHARDVDTNLSPIMIQSRGHLLLFETREKLNFDLLYMPHLNSNSETQNDNSSQLLAGETIPVPIHPPKMCKVEPAHRRVTYLTTPRPTNFLLLLSLPHPYRLSITSQK